MNDNTNKVYVMHDGVGYEVYFKWVRCDFRVEKMTPPIKTPSIFNAIKTKAIDKAIEAEYDAWVADNALDSLDEEDDLGWTLLGKHNIYSGGGLDKH